jgi:flagellar protein FlgJ
MQSTPSTLDAAPINALDPRGLSQLQRLAKTNDPKALRAAAQQFEALFLQMVLKSMRDATPREGLFDNDQSRMYEGLLDQQLSQVLSSKRGVGLAAVIERQLGRGAGAPAEFPEGLPLEVQRQLRLSQQPLALPATRQNAPAATNAVSPAPTFDADESGTNSETVRRFVEQLRPLAEQAQRQTGIPAPFMIAQAALETGWGRHEPRRADGTPSYNLFGIKGGGAWAGESVQANTLEVIQGVPQQRRESFRAYGSYAEGFADYARLIAGNPRYAPLRGLQDASGFAQGLQRAGYATDPAYAAKLSRVIATVFRQDTSTTS